MEGKPVGRAIAILAGVLVTAVTGAAAAQAATFCVHTSGSCPAGQTDEGADLQQALTDAGAGSGNTVSVGAGSYDAASGGGFTYTSANPVAITGVGASTIIGPNQTNNNNGNTILALGSAAVTVSDLDLAIPTAPPYGFGAIAATTTGPASFNGVSITGGYGSDTGVVFGGDGGSFASGASTAVATIAIHSTGTGTTTVTDSTVNGGGSGGEGIDVSGGGTVDAQRVTAGGDAATMVTNGTLNIADSLLLPLFSSLRVSSGTNDGTINASGLTVYGPGTSSTSYGPLSQASGGGSATVNVDSSIFTNVKYAYFRGATGSGAATLVFDYSDDTAPVSGVDIGGPGTLTTAHDVNITPGFVNAGSDFHLSGTSPQIDAGDPAGLAALESNMDLGGSPRIVGAARDIGAYEYQLPVASVSAPATATTGTPITFDGTASSDPNPGATLIYAWSFDDGTTATTPTVSHAFATGGLHVATLTVSDGSPFSATAQATVMVTVPAADGIPPVVTLSAPTPNGTRGLFNAAGVPVIVNVSATDDTPVTSITCTDGVDGAAPTPIAVTGQAGSSPRTGSVSITATGTHALGCAATDSDTPPQTGAAPGSTAMPVTIKLDATSPAIAAGDLVVNATSSAGASIAVYSNITVSDPDAGDAPSVACTPAAPHLFAVGVSGVSCTATDRAGNTATAAFNVRVNGLPGSTATATILSLTAPGANRSSQVIAALGGKQARGVVYLSTQGGGAVVGATVSITDGKRHQDVTTGAGGSAAFTLAAGRARTITLTYAGSASQLPATLTARVSYRGYGMLHLTTARLPARGKAAFAGRVIGRNGKRAVLPVRLQYLTSRKRWKTVAVVRSDRKGAWRASVAWPRHGHAGSRTISYRVIVDGTASVPVKLRLP